jgi:hypothetical protein
MKHLIALFAFCLFASHSLATDPLTDAEKKRLADVELAAKRKPSMREAAKTYSAARQAYTEDRRKFPADRDKSAGKVYREATAAYEAALKEAVLGVDPSIEPLWTRQAELKQLGLDKANEGETVADSDSPRNQASKAIQDIPGLPRVLLIGDSISIGYTLPVRELLKGQANVHRIPQNGGATDVGLEKMAIWLSDGKWDVIHFNFGLHDAKYLSETTQRTSREQYLENLRSLVDQMKATGATLIFATTTPVPKEGILSPTRKFDSIEQRNEIAVRLMQEQGVAIDDLYAVALPAMTKVGRENDVHFSPEGYKLLAKAVARSIEIALKK